MRRSAGWRCMELIELERLIEAEESEEKKDKIAVKSLVKVAGYNKRRHLYNRGDCIELMTMYKVQGVSAIQAYYRALDQVLYDGKGAAVAAAGTGSDSGSDARVQRSLKRNIQKRKQEKAAEEEQAQKRATKPAGPCPWRKDSPGSGQESDTATEEEQTVIDLTAAGTGSDSGSGTGIGAGSGKPVYSAEFAAGTETDREHAEEERKIRRKKREVSKAKALKDDEEKKA